MVGNLPDLYDFSSQKNSHQMYIPLEFWFCRYNGLALPLVSLASANVKISVKFRKFEQCTIVGPTHSMEIVEDICPFLPGDYIEQTLDRQTVYGYVINYDYVNRRLFYVKIHSPTALKKNFEAKPDATSNNLFDIQPNPKSDYTIRKSTNLEIYVQPKPGTREMIENIRIPKLNLIHSYLYVDYVLLDNEERRRFTSTNHEYLIEQIQREIEYGIRSPNPSQKLNFLHLVKEFYWVTQLDLMIGPNSMNDYFNYTTSPVRLKNGDFYGQSLVQESELILNSVSRFGSRTTEYVNLVQPYEHHWRGPQLGINTYSIALIPEEQQPSSAINMSKVDQAELKLKLNRTVNPNNTARIRTYCLNYNVLRIAFNMGSLAFEADMS